jgi:hypothetical protein
MWKKAFAGEIDLTCCERMFDEGRVGLDWCGTGEGGLDGGTRENIIAAAVVNRPDVGNELQR